MLACELPRRGISVRLIEARLPPRRRDREAGAYGPVASRCSTYSASSMRVMAHGRIARPIRSTAADGLVTVSGAGAVERPDTPCPAGLITPQWRIEEALRERLAELGGEVDPYGIRQS